MSGAAAVMEGQRAEIDVAALIAAAIKAKAEKAAAKYALVEETPEGEALTWNVTHEQIAKINGGDRAALDAFFLDEGNYKHITSCAWQYMRNHGYLKSVISYEDLINQVYVDLLAGFLKLRPWNKAITRAVYTSFRFTAVGGLDEEYIPFKEVAQCQKRTN